MSDDVPGWDDGLRSDGAQVKQGAFGYWYVTMPDDRPPVVACPCCAKGFYDARSAKVTANALCPVAARQ